MRGITGEQNNICFRADRFTDQAFFRFFRPAFLSNFSLAIGALADCFFVGMKMKAAGLSAIAFGIPIYLFYNILSYSFSIGGSICYSTALANGHPDEGNRIFNNIWRFLLILYVTTAALGIAFLPQLLNLLGVNTADVEVYALTKNYVRAQLLCVPVLYLQGPALFFLSCDGAPVKASAALTVSNTIDVVLNYVFVVRAGMGPEGSVWSTVIGAAVMLIICSTHIFGKKGSLRFCASEFRLEDLTDSAKIGIATAIQYLYVFLTALIANKVLMAHGGTEAVAVFDVIYNMTLFAASISDSMEMGMQSMVRSFRAEKNGTAVKRTYRISMKTGLAFAVALTLATCLLAKQVCSLFTLDSVTNAMGSKAILIYSISIIPAAINQITIYYDQAAEREKEAFILSTLRTFVFWLISLLAIMHFAPDLFFAVYAAAELLTLVAVAAGRRERKKDWQDGDGEHRYVFMITKDTDLGAEVEAFQNVCDKWECTPSQAYFGTLVLEELCAVIIQDAKSRENSDITIIGTALECNGEISLFIRDDSVKFNPFELKGQNEEDTVDLGIDIVRKKAKEFFYRRYQGFNTLVVRM